MRSPSSRRDFFADVARGALIATVGSATASDLGLSSASAAFDGEPPGLTFGALEGLVELMQETPAIAHRRYRRRATEARHKPRAIGRGGRAGQRQDVRR